ncbi:MAG: EAL domain-containing protein [Solirubrobacteraceae bacterium]
MSVPEPLLDPAGPATPPQAEEAALHAELDRILAARAIVSRYQPIVQLGSGQVAGYEALARGPQGSRLEFPDRLFDVARAAGRLDELDATCRAAAMAGAATSALSGPSTLFVNTEPETTAAAMTSTYDALLASGGGARVVFEFTERALTARPADVLEATDRLRRLGAGIALDDVGVDPRSLALLPFVQPDVVKLDMSVIQGARTQRAARVMHAVGAYAEQTGAAIVAEGIETREHLAVARSLGATHGQGWLFGRPEAPPETLPFTDPLAAWDAVPESTAGQTAFQMVVASGRPVQTADKALLLALSRQLELHAFSLGHECVVLGNLQHERHLSRRTADRYADLADRTAFCGLIGAGLSDEPVPGVRGGSYAAGDPLAQEWSVIVISPHFAAAMLAYDLGDTGADLDRRFSSCLTYDRALVAKAARALMRSIANR